MDSDWIFFRRYDDEANSIEDEDYQAIAQRVVKDAEWPGNLTIWGTYVIMCTAGDLPGAIRSPAAAAAARINIHLHRQALFGAERLSSDQEEPFTDE